MVDGHHRILAAKQEGQKSIDVHLVEYLSSEDTDKKSLGYKRIEFEERTGLHGLDLPKGGNYDNLLLLPKTGTLR